MPIGAAGHNSEASFTQPTAAQSKEAAPAKETTKMTSVGGESKEKLFLKASFFSPDIY